MTTINRMLVTNEGLPSKLKDGCDHVTDLFATTGIYSNTSGGEFMSWSSDVNLGPHDPAIPTPQEDVNIEDYYNILQRSLYENNLPETVDRTDRVETGFTEDDVTITLLSSPLECFSILRAGGQACPNRMLLVMSSSWISKVKSKKNPELYSLMVHKGIMFGRGGSTSICVFNPPRRVTYLVNFFTRAVTEGERYDGEELEKDLDCPMSSSLELVRRVDNKVYTRVLMARAGGSIPETLAFTYQNSIDFSVPNGAKINIINLNEKTGVENLVEEEVLRFLGNEYIKKYEQIVVKPSGSIWHGCAGVSFHSVNNMLSIKTAILDLLQQLEPGDNILVEAFIALPPPADNKKNVTKNLTFRLRAIACRGPGDKPVATNLVCGIGDKNTPLRGTTTFPQSLDTTLHMWGIEVNERRVIATKVRKMSEDLLQEIINEEKKLSVQERGGVGSQTDIIGVDFVIGERDGEVDPFVIEVNSHDCTITCQRFESVNPQAATTSTKPLVDTMIERSQHYIMSGKRIMVIGAGGYSKRFIWPAAQGYGIRVTLIDDNPDKFAIDHVDKFYQYDFSDHTEDTEHATKIINMLGEEIKEISGCLTFWEDCGPLAARICEKLELNGPGLNAALIAKKKSSTQQVLRSRNEVIAHFPKTSLSIAKAFPLDSASDIEQGLKEVGIPAVIKLEYGSSGVGVRLVNKVDDAIKIYQEYTGNLKEESDYEGIGLGHGNDMMLMEYIDGTEHDIDVIIFNRQLVAAFVSDNGPTRPGRFTETAALMPSCLPPDRINQIITAAYQCCVGVGLTTGTFNVEMKMTSTGPRLLEINARMGGFYLRDWIKTVYGVDMVLCSMMCAAGVRPIIARDIKPRTILCGVMCIPSVHGKYLVTADMQNTIQSLVNSGTIRWNPLDDVHGFLLSGENAELTEEPIANIATNGSTVEEAKEKLLKLCNKLKIHNERKYDVSHFLRDFKSFRS